jgi:outer membrane protein
MKEKFYRKSTAIITNLLLIASLVAFGFAIGSIYTPTPTTASGFTVGYVDIEALLMDHPAWDSVKKKIDAYDQQELAKLEKASKDATTPAKKQENLNKALDIREKMKEKHKELTKPIYDDILKKAKEVGKESGVEVVLDAAVVLWGGLDLTPVVKTKLSKTVQ